jgi:hypothetical protein
MVTVDYDELSLAFDFVSSGAPMEHQAFVSLDTGRRRNVHGQHSERT